MPNVSLIEVVSRRSPNEARTIIVRSQAEREQVLGAIERGKFNARRYG